MATTITVSETTRQRLADYKRSGKTYDDVLNELMDAVPLEEVTATDLAEHRRRLSSFKGVSLAEFNRRIRKPLKKRR